MAQPCFQIGDQVIFTQRHGHKSRRRQKTSEKSALIIGFDDEYVGRLYNQGRKPGVYRNLNHFRLQLEDGRERSSSVRYLRPNNSDRAFSFDTTMRCWREVRYPEDFLRELPDVPLWEGDYVRVKPGIEFFNPGYVYRVNQIRYNTSLHSEPTSEIQVRYLVTRKLGKNYDDYLPILTEEDLELVKRGQVWQIYHGEQVTFSGIAEEASFYVMLGHAEKVHQRSRAEPLVFETEEEAKDAVRRGAAHAYVKGFLFEFNPRYNVVRFRDPELGRRIAEATLAGLGPIEY